MPIFSRRGSNRTPQPASSAATDSALPADASPNGLEPAVQGLGEALLNASAKRRKGFLSAKFYADRLMAWSMKDPDFKVNLFRFVDVLPVLDGADSVHEMLVEYLTQPGVTLPPGVGLGLSASGVAKGLATSTITSQIRGMADKFIAGVDGPAAMPRLEQLRRGNIGFSVDLLGEVCLSDAEADDYQQRYLDLIRDLADRTKGWADNELLERDDLGEVPRVNVSVKISALSGRLNEAAPDAAIEDLNKRLLPLLETARDLGVFINFDMEHSSLKPITIEAFKRSCAAVEFDAGIAVQAYLRAGDDDARDLARWAHDAGRIVTVRLIKGAYWDYETILAEQTGWTPKVWATKPETDACFERMGRTFVDAAPSLNAASGGGIKLALGSHNVRSIAATVAYAESRGLPRSAIELQMLHGMADEFKAGAVDQGFRVREYVPVGELIPGMAYLVRRLLENTSNESWLIAGTTEKRPAAELLAPPRSTGHVTRTHAHDADRHALSPGAEGVGDGRPFLTEPPRDLSQARTAAAFTNAIERSVVPHVENDRTPEDARAMVTAAHDAFEVWRSTPVRVRADVLLKTAADFRARRDELAGIVIRENGKTWHDADGEVTEAIDFLEYYARGAVDLFEPKRLGRFAGERNETSFIPRGVAAVISPWNFPFAIACGMTAAALVTGNTVVLKPAEQTTGTAKVLVDALHAALQASGGSRDVLHLCPGPGETTGAALVRDPRVSLIAFTGSKAVGLDILAAAGHTPDTQPFVKRVVCEMGGKNAIIVDETADLDEAVLGVRNSAFGFAGQKCSACSRAIVVDPAGPEGRLTKLFLSRLADSTRSLAVGSPLDPATDVGPVIDDEAADRIGRAIASATEAGIDPLVSAKDFPDVPDPDPRVKPKRTVSPHIFAGVTPEHAIARDEIFGPVLAVMHAPSVDAALDIANDSLYRLTGGVFSRSPSRIAHIRERFRVGNLYINRGITGALVGRQPFGGFGLSGVGSKAGGEDYLRQFVDPIAVTENTMRRGFAPELENASGE